MILLGVTQDIDCCCWCNWLIDFFRQYCFFVSTIQTKVTYEKYSLLGHRMLKNLILILFPENSPQNVWILKITIYNYVKPNFDF